MKNFCSSNKLVARAAGSWLATGFCVCMLAIGPLFVPVASAAPQGYDTLPTVKNIQTTGVLNAVPASAGTSVKVDQQPLIVRPNTPPNIVLMLDDSGSMVYDYMPDWDYIGGGVCKGDSDRNGLEDECLNALRDSDINGTYYSPDVVYSPPPTADGGSFPSSPGLSDAYKNGFDAFDPTTGKIKTISELKNINATDITKYNDDYPYYTKITSDVTTGERDASPGCAPGDYYSSYIDKCHHQGGYTTTWLKPSRNGNGRLRCNRGDDLGWHDGEFMCRHREYTEDNWYDPKMEYPFCPDGDYNETTQKCDVTEVRTAYLFTYTTKSSDGTYTPHFVAKGIEDCAVASSKYPGSDCDYSADTQQNVANWFSYYRTRILLAKSGLMQSFSTLDATYRVGFGSIDGGVKTCGWYYCGGNENYKNLPTNRYSYTYYDVNADKNVTNYLAEVQTFGSGINDQKSTFWSWIAQAVADGATPLRQSLQAVGEYYKTDQPWETFEGESGYESGASNPVLACRQSYTILTTDGFWNGNDPSSVANQDGSDGDTIRDPNGQPHKYIAAAPYTDSRDDTLADVAMKYWKNDLRIDIDNEVPTNNADMAFWQHMVTFTLGMGFTPSDADGNLIDKATVKSLLAWAQADDSANDGVAPKPASLTWGGWPKPGSDSVNNIADLVHAGVDGHGGFYSATDPVSFVNGIQTALDRASERVGSGSGVAANSTQLQSDSAVYQAIYHTVEWTGELRAFPITADGLSKTLLWDAAQMMPADTARNIQTWNPDTGAMVAFENPTDGASSDLSSDELTALGTVDGASAAQVVDWLRGSHVDEESNGGKLRNRTVTLGDIVDSQPVYVGKVDANQFSGRSFTGSDSFVTTYANTVNNANNQEGRSPRLYVASNDGMLHGFNADTGAETFAFLPAAVITHGIAKTAQPNYGKDANPHQFFNDGQLTIADAYIDEGTGASWHTILVGTTGRGSARAVYALDVTDPANVKVLWERSADDSDTNSDYIGQITGKPIIAQVADANGDDTWVVLIGNGYNSAKDTAALLQFNLQTGTLHVHTTDDTETGNGLATPAVWLGIPSNGLSSVAYAGDLKGNVWKFSLVSYGTDSKGNGTITGTPDSAGSLVYVAKDDSGNRQPITAGMLIGQDPDTSDLWLFFGTGRYLSSDDITDTSVQTWYGLVVEKGSTSSTMTAVTEDSTRSDLAERKVIAQYAGSTVTKDGKTIVTSPTRVVSLAPDLDPSTPSINGTSGWYIDLLAPTAYAHVGERMVIPIQFNGTMLLGTSIVPKSDDLCNPSGTSWLNLIDPFTGTNPQSGGFDVNHDGVIDGNDLVDAPIASAVGSSTTTIKVVASGHGTNSMANSTSAVSQHNITSLTNGELVDDLLGGSGSDIKRVSWREMVNP